MIHQSGYVITKSKIPLKCYIGITKNSENTLKFADVTYLDVSSGEAKKIPYVKVIKEETKTLARIQEFLDSLQIKDRGITIHFLSEIPRGHSFGFSDVSSAILSLALHTFYGKIKPEVLTKDTEFEKLPEYEDISRLAWEFSLFARYGNTISQGIQNTLRNSSEPISVCCQKFDPTLSGEEIVESKEVIVFPIENALNHGGEEKEIPLDYGVIFTGIETNSKQIEEAKEVGFSEPTELKAFTKKHFGESGSGFFFDEFLTSDEWTHSYGKILGILSIKTVYLLEKLYQSGLDFSVMDDFINHLNNQRKLISIISGENHFSEEFSSLFRKFQSNPMERLGILPIYSTKLGGGCLFALKPGVSRHTLEVTLAEIQKSYPDAKIEYCSYTDGKSEEGVQIEQFVNGGVFSKYVQKNQVLYTNTLGESYIATPDEILKKESAGVIIDLISKKICVNGIRLTSKEVPAQSTTSEVLAMLIERMGQDISNKELPASSYSSNKNDMLGKITLPIMRIIRETYKEELPLSCTGGIGEFYLRLNPTTVRMGVMRRI